MAKVSAMLSEIITTQQRHGDVLEDHELTLYGDARREIPGLVKDTKMNTDLRNKLMWMVLGGSIVSTAIGTLLTFLLTYLIELKK